MDYTVPLLPHIFCGWSLVSRIHRSLLLQHRSFESSILKLWVTLNSDLGMLNKFRSSSELLDGGQTGVGRDEWESLRMISALNKLETICWKWGETGSEMFLARAVFFQASCYLQCIIY